MSPELSRRVGRALAEHWVTYDERDLIVQAADSAREWMDLSAEIRRLISEIESRPGMGKPPPFIRRPQNRVLNLDPREVDLTQVQADFERHLDALLDEWTGITRTQRNDIVNQVQAAVSADDIRALADLKVSTKDAQAALLEAMTAMALAAAQRVVDEAARQGVNINPVASDTEPFAAVAATTAALLGVGLANAAGREALRRWTPGVQAADVAQGVATHLEGLSDVFLRDNLGGALSAAETTGRANTMMSAPSAAIYGSEVLDANTCGPCQTINGKWIGNSDDPDIASKIAAVYPRGYVNCLGGDRCRGQIVGIFRQQGQGFVGAAIAGDVD